MILFQNISITQDMHDCLIPEDLKVDVIYYLKEAHIPYKSIPCKEVEDGPAKEKAINIDRQDVDLICIVWVFYKFQYNQMLCFSRSVNSLVHR